MITALAPTLPAATFVGLGGAEMESAGQHRIVRAEDVAVMGITEILRHIPFIYRSYRKLVRDIQRHRPDVAVLIDFPDVNFRLAKHLHRAGVPVLWFVSPQLWAWKRRRLRWVQERVQQMFVIFPFEETFYKSRGVQATFVGHPLADLPLPEISREAYAAKHNLDPAKDWVALLPGSRWKEVRAHVDTMVEYTKANLGVRYILPVASTLNRDAIAQMLGGASITLVDDAREALFHARASIVASGTATVQAALIGNPFIVIYRVSDQTFRLAKRLVRYPAEIGATEDAAGNLPIAMVNLIAGRRIVPELLQERFNPQEIAHNLQPLLEDSEARSQQLQALKDLRARLTVPGDAHGIVQLRDAVLQTLKES